MTTKITIKFILLLTASLILSIVLGRLDTQPHWDDTGVTAFAILLTSMFFGFMMPRFAWLWALIMGSGIALFNIFLFRNYGSIMVYIFSFAGAYGGLFFSKIFFSHTRKH